MVWHDGNIWLSTWRWAAASLFLTFSLAASALGADTSATSKLGLQPSVEKARGGQCVEDPAYMRRNHMKLLKHQRDDTVHGGIRTGKYSLKECVACHASQSSQSVNAEAGNFCQSCHLYAAVTIDCFECHASKPGTQASQVVVPNNPVTGQTGRTPAAQWLAQLRSKP